MVVCTLILREQIMKEYNKIRDNKIAAARKRKQRRMKGPFAKDKKVTHHTVNIENYK